MIKVKMNSNQLLIVSIAIILITINQTQQVNSAGTSGSCRFDATYGFGSNMSVVTSDYQEFHLEKLLENGYPKVATGENFLTKWGVNQGFGLDSMLEKSNEFLMIAGDKLRVYGPGPTIKPGRNMTTEFPELVKGVTDPRIHIRAAADIKGTAVLIGSVDDGNTNYVFFIDSKGDKLVSTEFDIADKLPDSLHYLGEKNNKHLVLVNFNSFVAIYRLGSVDKPEDFKLLPRPDVDYHLTNEWTGCAPEFCWNADIDAATVVLKTFSGLPEDNLLIFRGNYMFTLSGGTWDVNKEMASLAVMKPISNISVLVSGYVDGAMYFNSELYLAKDDRLTWNSNYYPLDTVFNATKGEVSAILRLDQYVYIFQGTKYSVYKMTTPAHSSLLSADNDLKSSFPGLIHDSIDAAYQVNGSIYLHSGSFFYRGSSKNSSTSGAVITSVTGPTLAQESLFNCKQSAIYRQEASSLAIGVANYDEFIAYRKRFDPSYVAPVTAAPGSTSTSSPAIPGLPGVTGDSGQSVTESPAVDDETGSTNATSTTTVKPDDSGVRAHLVLLAFFGAAVIIALIALLYFNCKPKKSATAQSQKAPKAAVTSNTTVPLVTSQVAPSNLPVSASPVATSVVVTKLSKPANGSIVRERSDLNLLDHIAPAV